MKNLIKLGALTAAMAAGCAFSTPAAAQATRTWVSGVGDDANPCSRTAPCKTFAGAISKTAAGGEISCIDPGGYGSVTITKSIAIICDNVEAGVLAPMTNGVTINAASTDTVFLSGLEINGAGSGVKGIRYLSAGAVQIHNSKIIKMQGSNGAVISFAPSSFGNLTVSNTIIANNGNGATGGGIEIIPTGSATWKVTLQNVRSEANANGGIRIDTAGTTGGNLSVVVEDSHVVAGRAGVTVNATTAGAASVMIVRSEIANNFGAAITANGANAIVRVSDSTITGNQSGVAYANGAAIVSYNDNRLDANPAPGGGANGVFSSTLIKK